MCDIMLKMNLTFGKNMGMVEIMQIVFECIGDLLAASFLTVGLMAGVYMIFCLCIKQNREW